MADIFHSCAARVLDVTGRPVGAAFLVAPGQLVTCAHVVRAALALGKEESAKGRELVVDFPLVEDSERISSAQVSFIGTEEHQPIASADDVALLQLLDQQPEASVPVTLASASELWDHRFKSFGFPVGQPDGVWASGLLRSHQRSGLVQLESTSTVGYRIQPGFSGAPIWDEDLGAVVGMVVTSEKDADVRAAFMIPASRLLTALRGIVGVTQSQESSLSGSHDWGNAPDIADFVGRDSEIVRLRRMVLDDSCAVVGILGLPGAGKTALSVAAARELSTDFSHVFWRSLKDLAPPAELIGEALHSLDPGTDYTRSASNPSRLDLLMGQLRRRRCLMILDNFESVLDADNFGQYRPNYDEYGVLLRRAIYERHSSCVILTSRERPRELTHAPIDRHAVGLVEIQGLLPSDSVQLLMGAGITGTDEAWTTINERYSGNPLMLKLIAEPVRELFNGELDAFLDEAAYALPNVHGILDGQFERLSRLERELMYWVATERGTVSINSLRGDLVEIADADLDEAYADDRPLIIEAVIASRPVYSTPVLPGSIVEALTSLRRKSLVEVVSGGFTVQAVIQEYCCERLVQEAYDEVVSGRLRILATHAMLKATAKDAVRESQVRCVLRPLLSRLLAAYGVRERLEHRLLALVHGLRTRALLAPGYLAGNVLNMLVDLGCDLRGVDFSGVVIAQAYLVNVSLWDANFRGSIITSCVFSDTFGSILSTSFSEDGRHLATGSADGRARVWTLGQRSPGAPLVMDLRWVSSITGDDWIWSVAFDARGGLVAAANDNFKVRLFDVATGDPVRTLEGHADRVWSVDFGAEGRTLVSGGDDGSVRLWDVLTGACTTRLAEGGERVLCVTYDVSGTRVATGSADGVVNVWEVATQERILEICELHAAVAALSFSPDGMTLTTGDETGALSMWDCGTGQLRAVLHGHQDAVTSVAFSPDGSTLYSASRDRTIRVWNPQRGECDQVLEGHSGLVWSVSASPDGRFLVSGADDQTLRVWDSVTGEALRTLHSYRNEVWAAGVSTDANKFAAGYEDGLIRIWDIERQRVSCEMRGHEARVRGLSAITDDGVVASASEDGTVRLWDVSRNACIRVLRGHAGPVWSVDLKGDWVASAGDDGTIRVWDARTGELVHKLDLRSPVWCLAMNTDGLTIATAHEDRSIRILDLVSGHERTRLMGHTNVVRSIAFGQSSSALVSASADCTARLWNLSDGTCARVFEGHTSFVKSVAFDPGGLRIATGSDDLSAKVWNVATGECSMTLRQHEGAIKVVRFMDDGATLLSGGEDGRVVMWDLTSGEDTGVFVPDRPYERMDIRGVTGITDAQRTTLRLLGARE